MDAEKEDRIPSIKEMGGAFFLGVGLYAAGNLLGKALLPTVFGVEIHPFAWMIILVTILAMLGVVPQETKAAAKRLTSFMSSCLVLIIMVGVGADTDLNELANAITLSNVVMAFLIVVGAILGSAVVGQLVGFYPIDSAITAGLCMANRGGSGDLAVLGASHRMGLIAYAQLSSRLGRTIVFSQITEQFHLAVRFFFIERFYRDDDVRRHRIDFGVPAVRNVWEIKGAC